MRIQVVIAIYQSNAIFKAYCPPSIKFNFIKGTLHNQQKKIQHMNGSTILDVLNISRCGSFRYVCVILDDAKICMYTHTRISSFSTFWAA